jgi:hypothetical protein
MVKEELVCADLERCGTVEESDKLALRWETKRREANGNQPDRLSDELLELRIK